MHISTRCALSPFVLVCFILDTLLICFQSSFFSSSNCITFIFLLLTICRSHNLFLFFSSQIISPPVCLTPSLISLVWMGKSSLNQLRTYPLYKYVILWIFCATNIWLFFLYFYLSHYFSLFSSLPLFLLLFHHFIVVS